MSNRKNRYVIGKLADVKDNALNGLNEIEMEAINYFTNLYNMINFQILILNFY